MKIQTLSICLGSAILLTCQVQAQNYYANSAVSSMARLGQITGATIQDTAGQALGQIQDLVANTTTGNIQFALMSLNQDKNLLTAVPWQLLRQTGPNTYVFNGNPNLLETAQTFPAGQWPDFTQPTFVSQTYAHYQINTPYPAYVGGNVMVPSGVVYGSEEYYEYPYGKPWIRPQPDGHNTFPFLHEHWR